MINLRFQIKYQRSVIVKKGKLKLTVFAFAFFNHRLILDLLVTGFAKIPSSVKQKRNDSACVKIDIRNCQKLTFIIICYTYLRYSFRQLLKPLIFISVLIIAFIPFHFLIFQVYLEDTQFHVSWQFFQLTICKLFLFTCFVIHNFKMFFYFMFAKLLIFNFIKCC